MGGWADGRMGGWDWGCSSKQIASPSEQATDRPTDYPTSSPIGNPTGTVFHQALLFPASMAQYLAEKPVCTGKCH